jgi:release factor glutamine methyltransferase
MNYKQLFIETNTELCALYNSQEAENITWLLIAHFAKKSKLEMLLDKSLIPEHLASIIKANLIQLVNHHTPIQYIIGEEYFYGLPFIVNKNVLIPRPETEELVDIILKEHKSKKDLQLLDIGTGSGCIPIAIKHHQKDWMVSACDISTEALLVARQNAKKHAVDIHFFEKDILVFNEKQNQYYDIIISNPPYILLPEQQEMRDNVLLHEPHLALFVSNNDALQFYKAIIHFALLYLLPTGKLYFECNELYAQDVANECAKFGFINCKVMKDLQEKNRFVVAEKK